MLITDNKKHSVLYSSTVQCIYLAGITVLSSVQLELGKYHESMFSLISRSKVTFAIVATFSLANHSFAAEQIKVFDSHLTTLGQDPKHSGAHLTQPNSKISQSSAMTICVRTIIRRFSLPDEDVHSKLVNFYIKSEDTGGAHSEFLQLLSRHPVAFVHFGVKGVNQKSK